MFVVYVVKGLFWLFEKVRGGCHLMNSINSWTKNSWTQKFSPITKKGAELCCSAPLLVVALPGLEPGNAAPKTVVLPLHYKAILCQLDSMPSKLRCKITAFF